MEIRVLGSSGGSAPGRPPTSFLVDGVLAVDAGAVATVLELEEQARVHDVLLTHSHLDHIRDLPLLLINSDRDGDPLRVHSLAETLEALRTHMFNREIWFEAFSTPTVESPLLESIPMEIGKPTVVAGYTVTGFALHHTVPSTGWLVEKDGRAAFFAGDTDDEGCLGPVAEAAGDRLKAVFLEASFPDAFAEFARKTGHLTPAGLGRAARDLPAGALLHVTHMKPGHEERIVADVAALGDDRIRAVRSGDRVRI